MDYENQLRENLVHSEERHHSQPLCLQDSQVANRRPVDFPILSEPGVRFQFWPKNRFSETAKCYSCCDTHGARSHCSQYIQDITTGNFANSCNICMNLEC